MTGPMGSRGTDVGPLARWKGPAPAKTNLLLKILDREVSGYHGLETLFQKLELADEIELMLERDRKPERRDRMADAHFDVDGLPVRFEVEGVGAETLGPGPENLVIRALAAVLHANVPRSGATMLRVRLVKRIPHGAGLGGGSSDAATMLRGLNELFGFPLGPRELMELGGQLGSDVPFFLSPSPLALAWGRGHRLLSLPPLPARPVLLVIPPFRISTPDAYAAYAAFAADREAGAKSSSRHLHLDALADWSSIETLAENDFHAPLETMNSRLGDLRSALSREGAAPAILSGSGSAVVGIFRTSAERDHALHTLSGENGLTLIPTRTVGGDESRPGHERPS